MDVTALIEARAPLPEHTALLRQRAAAVAAGAVEHAAVETFPGVVFVLGGQRYAVDARAVLHVSVLRHLTPLPRARPPLLGITQWRGDVLTLLDLRQPLGAEVRGLTDMNRILVMAAPRRFGILCDAAREMVDVEVPSIAELETSSGASLLRGITQDGLLVIDHEALFRAHGGSAPTTARGG